MVVLTNLEKMSEFCTEGEKVPFNAEKLLAGFTGSDNDPAFAQNFNSFFNVVSAIINNNAAITDENNVKILQEISANFAFSAPPMTIFPYFGVGALPEGCLEMNGQTFDAGMYPLLYAANGDSNVLADMRGYALCHSGAPSAPAFRASVKGQLRPHSHPVDIGTSTDGNHRHAILVPTPYVAGPGGMSTETGFQYDNDFYTENAGLHSHRIQGRTLNSEDPSGADLNIPASFGVIFFVKAI